MSGLARVADAAGGCGDGSLVRFHADPSQTYLIAVDGRDGATGDFSLSVQLGPYNDDLAQPQYMAEGHVNGTTALAGRESGETDHASANGSRSVWYAWTAPYAGRVRIDTCTSPQFASALAVYRQAGTGQSGLSLIAASTTEPACGTGAQTHFSATAGVTYLIAVDGHDGASGPFTLTIEQAPANDAFSAAQLVTTGIAVNNDTLEATHELGEPDLGGTGSVWYRWTPPYDGAAKVDVCAQPASRSGPTRRRPAR